jgi:flagellar basal-body rod protein FlgC
MDSLRSIMQTAASGMHAQGRRLEVISENVANADSTGSTPGADPYRRKTISFSDMVDRSTGANLVTVERVGRDMSAFNLSYDPAHPAANAEGYVKTPNVNTLIEMSDMREASRSYEANMNMLDTGRRMRSQTIDLLK